MIYGTHNGDGPYAIGGILRMRSLRIGLILWIASMESIFPQPRINGFGNWTQKEHSPQKLFPLVWELIWSPLIILFMKQSGRIFTLKKVKFFLWEVSHNAINTCNSVHRRFPHMALSPHRCIICKSNFDSLSHLFINCHFVNRFWKEISSLFGWITAFPNDINNLLSYTLTNHPLRRSCGCI